MAIAEREHSVNQFFSENIIRPEDEALGEAFALLSKSAGLPFPLTQPEDIKPEDYHVLVESRIEKMAAYRGFVTEFCRRYFPDDPDIVHASKIAEKISAPLDRIFADQLKNGITHGSSWEQQSLEGASDLKKALEAIDADDMLADYLMVSNRPLGDMLRYLEDVVLTAEQASTQEVSRKLELFAKQGHDAGKPVLLLTLAKYFTACPLEANARFFLPFTPKQQRQMEVLTHALWHDMKTLYHELGHEPPDLDAPVILGGQYLFGAGSELIYATSAEKLNSSGYVFFPNVTKEREELHALYSRFRLPMPRVDNSMFLLMIAHELGHLMHRVPEDNMDTLGELIPDLFSLLASFGFVDRQTVVSKDAVRTALLLRALAEFQQQARYTDPAYLASSRAFFNSLGSSSVINVNEAGEVIDRTIIQANVDAFLASLHLTLDRLLRKES